MDPDDIEKIRTQKPADLWGELDLLHHLVDKELARGKYPDALTFYWGIVLRKLVGLLRVKHCPGRHEFGFRYVKTDLPPEAAERLERLMWVANPEELAQKKAEAVSWAEELFRT
jgi:hypothetical protein